MFTDPGGNGAGLEPAEIFGGKAAVRIHFQSGKPATLRLYGHILITKDHQAADISGHGNGTGMKPIFRDHRPKALSVQNMENMNRGDGIRREYPFYKNSLGSNVF